MEEWKEYKLSEITTMKNGKKRPQGFGVFPVYGGNGIMDNTDCFNSERTIIVGRVGAYCGCVYECDGKCWVSDNAIAVYAKDLVDFYFLYYLMTTLDFHHHHIGGAQPLMTQDIIGDFTIKLPSLSVQKEIVSILKSLDDKIECNRRINDNFTLSFLLLTCFVLWLLKLRNDNLEMQAQALFKSRFVDFEPFKDGEFVESEMGMIPKGWRVGVYDDIISETISGDWGKDKEKGNYTHRVACIRGCDFEDIKNGLRGKTPERFILEKNYQNKHFCDKDMLVEISGGTATVSTGRVCPISQQLINKYNGDVVCTNFCRLVRPKKGYGAYMYYSWFNKYNNKVMFGYENGTSGIKNFRIKDFTSIEPVVLPPKETIIEFQNVIDSIQKQIQTRGTESQNLAQLRDTLLPRLMSGELKMNELTM